MKRMMVVFEVTMIKMDIACLNILATNFKKIFEKNLVRNF